MASNARRKSVPAPERNAFLELIDEERQGDEACQLVRRLVECTDDFPYEYCVVLDLPAGSTFGQAARKVSATLGCRL